MDIPEEIASFMGAAWGDRIAFAYLFRKLKDVTPVMVSDLVKNNKPLFCEVPETEWPKYQELLTKYNLSRHVTLERFTNEFQTRRPDLAKAALNEPNGQDWFNSQVITIRIKLGLEEVRWRKVGRSPST